MISPSLSDYGTHDESAYPELWEGCVGAWCPSLGPSGVRLYDYSGRANHGALVDMDPATDWIVSDGQYGLDLDGVNDTVICGPSGITGQAFTISAWVFQRTLTANPAIVRLVPSTGSYFIFQPTNRAFADNANSANLLFRPNPVLGRWNHFAMTFNSNSYAFYQNDVLELSGVFAVPLTVGLNSVSIGLRSTSINGLVDDVRIYQDVVHRDLLTKLANRRGIAFEPRRRTFTSLPPSFMAAWASQSNRVLQPVGAL